VKAVFNGSESNVARLSIVLPVIIKDEGAVPFKVFNGVKINAMEDDVFNALAFVPLVFHSIPVCTIIIFYQRIIVCTNII
jgi:hypothetical protein